MKLLKINEKRLQKTNFFGIKIIFALITFFILSISVYAETEVTTGSFTVGNIAPDSPYAWTPTTTHDKTQNFSWTQPVDGNGDPVTAYVCITNDTDVDSCSVVDTQTGANIAWYAFTLSETNWDYSWGSASRNYYVKLTPNDGADNGTVNDTLSFTLTDTIPTISSFTSDSASKGDKDVGEVITLSTDHADTDGSDLHNLRICKTDAIATDGTCPGGEWCNEHNSTFSTDASLACSYTALQGDSTSNTAYFFVCDCPPNDNTCPGQCSAAGNSHTFYVNHVPTASSVDVLPNNPTSAQDLNCSFTFADSDSDSEGTSTFRWFNWSGSAWVDSGITTQTVSSSSTSANEVWLCEVTPVDEFSFVGSPVNSTNESIQNTAPLAPTLFKVQDGTSSYDSSDPRDTHDVTPYLNWTQYDDDSDPITDYVCIATTSGNRDSNNCDAYFNTSTTGYITVNAGLAHSGTSVDYFVRLTPNDGSENGTSLDVNFTLINSVPNTPSSLNGHVTHNQTPTLAWTAADPDDGTTDHWPADSLTYHIRVGTSYGDGSYENNDAADKTGEVISSAIPWGAPGAVWANNTYYVSIWTTDGNTGGTSAFYNLTGNLYDYLPDITNVEMTDDGSAYSSCTAATCALNPIEHSNSTVAVQVTATDTDDDCDLASAASAYFYLCLDTGSCSPITANFSWEVDSVSRSGPTCTFTFTSNKTAADDTPAFFNLPDSGYYWYSNVSSQAGQRTSDAEKTDTWTFGTLKSIDYPQIVTLGNGGITLGSWNDGTTLALMTNWGNDNLNIQWNASDPNSGSNNWTLNNTDMQVDDDNSHTSESGPLAPVYLNGSASVFEPASGLQVCIAAECNDGTLNETLDTYYHIYPPLGLSAGTYNSTITITIT